MFEIAAVSVLAGAMVFANLFRIALFIVVISRRERGPADPSA